MGRRACNTPELKEHYSKKFGKVFDQIAQGEDPSEIKKFSVDHCLAMQVSVTSVVELSGRESTGSRF